MGTYLMMVSIDIIENLALHLFPGKFRENGMLQANLTLKTQVCFMIKINNILQLRSTVRIYVRH